MVLEADMHWLPDINIWLALTLKGHGHHLAALDWYGSLPEEDMLHFCRSTQTGLLRLLTTTAVLAAYDRPALSNKEAWKIQIALRGAGNISFAEEPLDLEEAWQEYAARSSSSPKLWMDAYLAAFANTGNLRLVTTDKAFRQFKGLELLVLE